MFSFFKRANGDKRRYRTLDQIIEAGTHLASNAAFSANVTKEYIAEKAETFANVYTPVRTNDDIPYEEGYYTQIEHDTFRGAYYAEAKRRRLPRDRW